MSPKSDETWTPRPNAVQIKNVTAINCGVSAVYFDGGVADVEGVISIGTPAAIVAKKDADIRAKDVIHEP